MNQPSQNPKKNNLLNYLGVGLGGCIVGGLIMVVVALFVGYLLFMTVVGETVNILGDVLEAFGL